MVITGAGFNMLVVLPTQLGFIKQVENQQVQRLRVPGELELSFTETGMYRITWESADDPGERLALIAPNYSTRNQIVFAAFYGVPLVLIGVVVWRWFRYSDQERKEAAQRKGAKWDAWQSPK